MENKRIIITGGASCGKTELIKEIEGRGFPCIHETARKVIKEGNFIPKTEDFQLEIFRRQIAQEETQKGFFDRSALDGIAYCEQYLGFVPNEIANFNYSERYDYIFLLDRLPFKQDGERVEVEEEEVRDIHQKIIQAYKKRDFNLSHVPVFPGEFKESLSRRADFVINYLERLCLI